MNVGDMLLIHALATEAEAALEPLPTPHSASGCVLLGRTAPAGTSNTHHPSLKRRLRRLTTLRLPMTSVSIDEMADSIALV